jgi:hypothetical protein
MARVFHRTTQQRGEAILLAGFEDGEGTWGTGKLWRGVWVTIGEPWDLGITGPPPGADPALLVAEVPLELFERYEWKQEDLGYREALIPAAELNRYPRWRGWECAECERVAHENSPGWTTELNGDDRVSVCPGCPATLPRLGVVNCIARPPRCTEGGD